MTDEYILVPDFQASHIHRSEAEMPETPYPSPDQYNGIWSTLTRQSIRGNISAFRWNITLTGTIVAGAVEILRPDADTPHWTLIATTGPTDFVIIRHVGDGAEGTPEYGADSERGRFDADRAKRLTLDEQSKYLYSLDGGLFKASNENNIGWTKVRDKLGEDVAYMFNLAGIKRFDDHHQL